MNQFTTRQTSLAERRRALRDSFLFADLSAPLLDRLAEASTVIGLAEGAPLFEKGDPADALYCVIAGKIRIATTSGTGKQIVLNLIEAGSVFGEIALIDGEPRSAGATAAAPCRLLRLDRADFDRAMESEPALRRHVLALLCKRLRWVSELLEDSAFFDLETRLAKRLLWLAEHHGGPHPLGTRIAAPLSQQELAFMLGVSREAVNKKLRVFVSAGIVAQEDGRLILCDPAALERIRDAAASG